MKLNPKLDYFIANKIENNNENRYILFEKTDYENLKQLISLCASSKKQEKDLLKKYTNDYWNEELHESPFNVLRQVVFSLEYRRREKGRIEIEKIRNKLFPNYEELQSAWLANTFVRKSNRWSK